MANNHLFTPGGRLWRAQEKARSKLHEASERGAGEQEIKTLTSQLRSAIDAYAEFVTPGGRKP